MKKFLITCIFVFICGLTYAQDRIELRDGESIKGKVVVVSAKEIKYTTVESLENSIIYTIPKTKVLFIQYADGRMEVINDVPPRAKIRNYFDENEYPKYQGDFSYGYAFGLGSAAVTNLVCQTLETVHGVRISPYLFAGVGISYNFSYYYEIGDDDSIATPGACAFFGNIRGCYPINRYSTIYMSLDLGGNFFNKRTSGNMPPQVYYAIGPSICFGRDAIMYVDFGIRFQHIAKQMNALMLRFAIGF